MSVEKVYELFKKYKWQEVTLDDANCFYADCAFNAPFKMTDDPHYKNDFYKNHAFRIDSSGRFKNTTIDVFTEGNLKKEQKYKIFMFKTKFSEEFDDVKKRDRIPPNVRLGWINPIIILGLTDDEENIDSSFNYWISELTDEERELIEEFRSEYFKLLPNLIY